MLKAWRKQLQHHTSVAMLRSTAKCHKVEKKKKIFYAWLQVLSVFFQHRQLTDSDNNRAFFRHFTNDTESTNKYVTKAVFIDLCLVIQVNVFFFTFWINMKLENWMRILVCLLGFWTILVKSFNVPRSQVAMLRSHQVFTG